MKKLFILVGLILAISTAKAQSYYATNNLAASNHVILSIPIDTQTISVWSTNTAASLVHFYDGFMIKTNTAYTNYTAALTDVVTTVITSSGSTNTFTNSVWKTTANPVAAANTAAVPLISLVVPAANVVATYNIPQTFVENIKMSNSAAGTSILLKYKAR
jgi:hypothetical protein